MEYLNFSYLNLFVLGTLVFWGAWGIFDKISLKHGAPLVVMIALNCFAPFLTVAVFVFLVQAQLLENIGNEVLFWTFLGALTYYFAMLMYLYALSKTEASFILGLTSSYPVIIQFCSTLILGEQLIPVRILGSILIAIGVVMIGFSSQGRQSLSKVNSRLRLWIAIIGATFCWGIWGVFDKKAINLSGAIEVFFCKSLWDTMFSAILIVLIVYFVRIKFSDDRNPENEEFTSLFFNPDSEKSLKGFFKPLFTKKLWIPALLSAFCLYAGGLTYLLALAQATASYVVVVTGCYPLIMYLLALLLLKEKFNKIRLLGILLITTGGVLTQLTQGQ